MSRAFIEMRKIVKIFKTPAGDFAALKGIDADFRQGEFVSVVGKSGSGKTTLANMLTGIDRPTSGTVQVGDAYVHKLNESQMARWRGRNLGVVFQFYQLLPMLSLLENVMLPMDFCNMYPRAERPRRAMELLDLVGLADLAHKLPAAASGGQQQSAAIARALANDPPLLVADEPTGNLDSRAADHVFRIFEDLARQGKTILMVTHDNSLADRAGRKMMLVDGEVIHEAVLKALPWLTPQQMLQVSRHVRVQRFAPGETIIHQGQVNEYLYLIAQGYTDVHLPERPEPVARLGPGQFFGEMELLRRGARAIASIKAALSSAVEVVVLDRQIFAEVMAEAQVMRESLHHTMQERLAQNARVLGESRYAYQTSLA